MSELPIPPGYIFAKHLSSGFFGPTSLVKLAGTEQTRDNFVCKYFRKRLIGDDITIKSFTEHLNKVKSISEPFVIPYNDIIINDEFIICIRPFIEDLDLMTYIQQGVQENGNMLFAQWRVLTRLIRFLHSLGIYPNFIKPKNIFISSNKMIILTDIYQPPHPLNPTVHKTEIYDIGFLAPEMFTDEVIDIKSDIWSLGIILWFMTTAKIPYTSSNIVVLLKQMQRGHIDIPDNFPCDVKEIITKILIRDPELRLSLDQIMKVRPGVIGARPNIPVSPNFMRKTGQLVMKGVRKAGSMQCSFLMRKTSDEGKFYDDERLARSTGPQLLSIQTHIGGDKRNSNSRHNSLPVGVSVRKRSPHQLK